MLVIASILVHFFRTKSYNRFIATSIFITLILLSGCADQSESHDQKSVDTNEISAVDNEKNETTNEEQTSEENSEKDKDEIDTDKSSVALEGEAKIHFIDVGQGNATLIKGADFTVLIDAGRHDRNDVVQYLRKIEIEHVDLIIGTHPHADHIGQIDQIIEAFPVKEVWMSGNSHTTRTFERVLNAIIDYEIDYYEPRAGDEFQIGSLKLDVINPLEVTGDFHDDSISLVVTYGEISILFTGDAEKETEEALLRRTEKLSAHIFQLGHHGSSTSNTARFLKAVNPEITIYSAGIDNSYGHPHREVIERLNSMEIPVYGTGNNGTIVVTTDGLTYTVDANISTKIKETRENENSEDNEEEPEQVASPDLTGKCIDINRASLDELQKINHIGSDRAQRIIDLRPFGSVDELTKINGIGPARLKEIKTEAKACVN